MNIRPLFPATPARMVVALIAVVLWGNLAFAGAETGPRQNVAPLVWTGAGTNSLWGNPDNWSAKRMPTADDDILLDGTSDKPSTYASIEGKGREAKGMTVRSITVSPDYKGVLQILSPGLVKGSVKLGGRVEVFFDAHATLQVEGPDLDLAAVKSIKVQFARGSFTLAAAGTQTFTPPADPAILVPELAKKSGGVLRLAGPLNTIMLAVDRNSAIDLNGHDVTAKLLQIAGPIQNLGGRTLTVTGAVGYTINAIGFMRNSGDALQPLDLAPEKPWKLAVKKEKLLVLYGPREEWEMNLLNCKIGNCDASGSEAPVWAYKGSVDAGGNKGIDFNPTLPDRTVKPKIPPTK